MNTSQVPPLQAHRYLFIMSKATASRTGAATTAGLRQHTRTEAAVVTATSHSSGITTNYLHSINSCRCCCSHERAVDRTRQDVEAQELGLPTQSADLNSRI